ncbi:uncharacterized protein LOC134676468 [Cydia fagiglandana]|uniref:uncharacterized protein LOC134676468 n=1 Tax=Cydia fagiglandana TaxID=1458189 RepID=UPI002FEDFD0D
MSKCIVKTQLRGPVLKIIFTVIKHSGYTSCEFDSEHITVDDLAVITVKSRNIDSNYVGFYMVMKKTENAKNYTVSVNMTYEKAIQHFFCPDAWVEVPITKKIRDTYINNGNNSSDVYLYTIEVIIAVHVIMPTSITLSTLNKELYKDTKSMDFNLQATDGTVPMHKSILFVHSQMFRTMLQGQWKETEQDSIQMPGETVQTLQHLKDYMYLGTIPEQGLEALLLLAKRCLMDNLVTLCIDKLIESVTPETFDTLVEFGCQKNEPKLMKGLFKKILRFPDDIINSFATSRNDKEKNPNDNDTN